MSEREEVTAGQIAEMIGWLRRLTPNGYQVRREILRRATDPDCAFDLFSPYPFTYKFPWWNEKCRVLREGAPCTAPLDLAKLELVPFHEEGEEWVPFDEMLRRANNPVVYPGCQGWGMHQGEDILARANELPEAMRKFAILLPDTILADEDGNRCIACLIWNDGEWQFGCCWLGNAFDRSFQFVRLSK